MRERNNPRGPVSKAAGLGAIAMSKYTYRLSAAVLAFSLGMVSFHLPRWGRALETVFRTTHVSGYNRPYSVLEGNTIRIKPYDATFQIPETWLIPITLPEPAQNLYLSRKELDRIFWKQGRDEEDAQVINAVLPFEDCAAHVGDRDWGNYFWNDLQARVYIVDLTPEEITKRIADGGLTKARSVFEGVLFRLGHSGDWHKVTLQIMDAPADFILMKDLDFYYRPMGMKTVVFVFLHSGGFQPTIDGILSSFKSGSSTDAKESQVQ
jgi:hypothetical protein